MTGSSSSTITPAFYLLTAGDKRRPDYGFSRCHGGDHSFEFTVTTSGSVVSTVESPEMCLFDNDGKFHRIIDI